MSNTPKLAHKRGPTLSLCMIVKNEAECLEQCLSTARPHVDEIVIVDTGSTDGTQDVAKRYADVFDEIEWPGSFSEARNHSLELATSDFIIILDGDEFLPDPLHWRRIHKALATGDVGVVKVSVRNLLPEGQLIAADRMWQERVFANAPEIRYEGKVHNQHYKGLMAYLARTGHRATQVTAEIIHTGYGHSASKMKEKYRARLDLLEAEVKNAPNERVLAYYSYQSAVVHYVLEDFARVLEIAGPLDFQQLEDGNAYYMHLLASQAAIKEQLPARALLHCNGMLALDRSEPVAYQITGLSLLMGHQFADGLLMMLEALSINSDASTSRFVLNNGEIMRMLAKLCRGAGLEKHAEAFDRLRTEEGYDRKEAAAVIQSLKFGLVQTQRAVA